MLGLGGIKNDYDTKIIVNIMHGRHNTVIIMLLHYYVYTNIRGGEGSQFRG